MTRPPAPDAPEQCSGCGKRDRRRFLPRLQQPPGDQCAVCGARNRHNPATTARSEAAARADLGAALAPATGRAFGLTGLLRQAGRR